MSFNGFCSNTLEFLIDNRLHNSKSWFDEHKAAYNDFVLSLFRELAAALSGHMLQIDPLFEVKPAVGKTISRIYRDIRFSKDKSLFRENMWLVFMRNKNSWPDFPAFYLDVFPFGYKYGVGHYAASRETMQSYRKLILKKDPIFMKAYACYEKQHTFQLMGEKYKRTLAPDQPDQIKEWTDRKNIYFEHSSTNLEQLFSKDLVGELVKGFHTIQPVYEFLCEINEERVEE
jgi:uncharacterized protein (TIGR02453 family)